MQYLEVRVERLPEARGHAEAPQLPQPVLEHPVYRRGGGQRALRPHAHRLQQGLDGAKGTGGAALGLLREQRYGRWAIASCI